MSGLPSALLTKWATPFDHETAKLRAFLPLGPYPNHLTEDKCLKLHAIYRDAVNDTEEIESIVASKLSALKRKRSQSGSTIQNSTANAVGWDQAGGGTAEGRNTPGGGGGGSGGVKDKQALSQQQQQQQQLPKKKKKKDKARTADGGGGGGGGGGDGQPPKKRKGNSGKDSKRSVPQGPAWATRTPKAGDQVAAKVEDEALWILATVEKHNEKKGFFVVVDDDAGDGKRRQFKLRRSNILTLPRPEEASGAIFPVGSRVMTLYPQTTTFYPATISGPFVEGRDGRIDYCVMQFQDDDPTPEGVLPHWRLPARFVRYRS
ncbi:conserved unknown protein [Ectocarpus siliculosus]|uniref:SGF29 C-terminal domain-containing protein n=1 Tax=Ectocarpus siliculosus TaxID=2880 RepID=D8LFR8_ECTSI|nr:conserved unknown protein [Ectocarpus siliculosus]|eukprot:CBN75642.1 conserved unknown protein [Ectocarpus siliculosus]